MPSSPLGAGRYDDDDVHLVARLYEAVSDGPFRFADGEVVEACFVTLGRAACSAGRRPVRARHRRPARAALSDPALTGAHTPCVPSDEQETHP